MSLAGHTIGGRALGNESVSALPTGVQCFLDGVDRMGSVAEEGDGGGGLVIERAMNEGGTAELTFKQPTFVPTEGTVVLIRRDGLWRFGGTIDRVSQRYDGSAIYYDCTCVDWVQTLDRLTVNKTFVNQPLTTILKDLLATHLTAEGFWEGYIEGGAYFPLVKAEDIRASEFLRDITEGSGHSYWISPLKGLFVIKTAFDTAPFTLDGSTFRASPASTVSREQYHNVQRVTVTGTTDTGEANEVLVERTNSTEIAARQAKEGGSGRYEVYTSITHPSSNDSVELQRLGISYGVIQLARSGQSRRLVTGSTDRFGLEPGQLATIDLPDFGLSGTYFVTRAREAHLERNRWRHEIELVQTSPHELELDAYLQIVGAGRAVVQLPVGIFSNIVEFLSNNSWIVPGSGDVEIEIDGFAPGGGGGGYDGVGPSGSALNGGAGGSGGKAVTFLTLTAGTQLDLVVPAAGTGGLGNGATTVNFTSPTTTTWVVPGTGSVRVEMSVNGAGGGSGSVYTSANCSGKGGAGGKGVSRRIYAAGTVLDVTVGNGGAGGSGSPSAGIAGGLSKVSLSGATVAQGNGGGGGGGTFDTSVGSPGASGSGTGDSVTTGGGAAGGAAVCTSPVTLPGNAGANGSVVFRYADADNGIAAGNVTASIGGVVKMQANGGGAGLSGVNGGAAGAPGSGLGDQVFTGEGSSGGAGGTVSSVNGKVGTVGKVQIRY